MQDVGWGMAWLWDILFEIDYGQVCNILYNSSYPAEGQNSNMAPRHNIEGGWGGDGKGSAHKVHV